MNEPMPNDHEENAADNAVLDAIADAIEQAQCPDREGPYGGYDYSYPDGEEPEKGRYVVREYRYIDERYGRIVHQTHDKAEHDRVYKQLTRRHIARAARNAYLRATSSNP